MTTALGKVIRFDDIRGYGFIAPSAGGDDVFMHANDLMVDKRLIEPGVLVEFAVEDLGRGLKASRVKVVGDRVPAGTPAMAAQSADGEEELCDVLMEKEYFAEITEILLNAAPSMTAEQIVAVRQRLMEAAAGHGWIDR